MPFNGAGTYVRPAGQPVVAGTDILDSTFNAYTADVATALSNCVTRDGQSPAIANIPMGGFKHTGLAAGTAAGESVRYEQAGTVAMVETHAAASKATPVDADEIPIADSAATFGLKKLTWANLKATLASTITSAFSVGAASIGSHAMNRDASDARYSPIGFSQFGGAINAATTLTGAQSGQEFYVTSTVGAFNISLPSPANGLRYKFFGVGGGNAVGLTHPTGSFYLPSGTTQAAPGTWSDVNLSNVGQSVEVWSDGSGWFVSKCTGYATLVANAVNPHDAVPFGQVFTPTNNTGAVSDLVLLPGQAAYIDFTSATSIPLHIACGDGQLYELKFNAANPAGGAAMLYLNPNNTTYASAFAFWEFYGVTNNTTGCAVTTESAFRMTVGGTCHNATYKASTSTARKQINGSSKEVTASVGYIGLTDTIWNDSTTGWTSLGTLACATAISGRVFIRRIA